MPVVLAPDSFKGTIAAADAVAALAAGWRVADGDVEIVARPMADGGEGTIDAFAAAVPRARRMPVMVTGPDGLTRDAAWLLLPATDDAPGGIGVVELASTSGIEVLGARLRPWDAHTVGFGQAIAAALDHGVSRLVLAIGSSASTDGGAGMLSALGARFADAAGRPIPLGARGLQVIASADLSELRPPPTGGATVLTDVMNPLLGASGAAAVYGPQKGFDAAGIARADAGLARLAGLLSGETSPTRAPSNTLLPDGAVDDMPGAGAAGGTGFGLLVWGAALARGAAEVAALVGLPAALRRASLVVTGEGSYDGQSAAGKVPNQVMALAAAAGVPVALVAGRIAGDADTSGFAAAVSLTDLAGSAQAAVADPAHWLRAAGVALARTLA